MLWQARTGASHTLFIAPHDTIRRGWHSWKGPVLGRGVQGHRVPERGHTPSGVERCFGMP